MRSITILTAVTAALLILSCNSTKPKKDCDKYLGTWHDKKENNPGDTLTQPGTLTVKKVKENFTLELAQPNGSAIKADCSCEHGRLINGSDLVPMEEGKIYFKTRFFSKE